MTILVVAGPKARDVMQAVSRADWSAAAFPWLSVRECFIGFAPATVMSVSFSGELAYEIHVPNASLYVAYTALREAGRDHGLGLFGAHAVDAMRLEKGYLHWKADILTEFDPFETGLERFVAMDKVDFIGKAALAERRKSPPKKCLVSLCLDDDHAPAHGGASLMDGKKVVGTITSGGYGHRVGKNLGYGFIDREFSHVGCRVEIDILGRRVGAVVSDKSLYDPTLGRVRS